MAAVRTQGGRAAMVRRPIVVVLCVLSLATLAGCSAPDEYREGMLRKLWLERRVSAGAGSSEERLELIRLRYKLRTSCKLR